jgi:hypothetical protein
MADRKEYLGRILDRARKGKAGKKADDTPEPDGDDKVSGDAKERGRALRMAIKSGDDEAICEAVRRCSE